MGDFNLVLIWWVERRQAVLQPKHMVAAETVQSRLHLAIHAAVCQIAGTLDSVGTDSVGTSPVYQTAGTLDSVGTACLSDCWNIG